MKTYIKNMVSIPCIIVVKSELDNLSIPYQKVEMGYVETATEIHPEKAVAFNEVLQKIGLGLVASPKILLIEKIKKLVLNMIRVEEELPSINFSHYLSKQLNYSYTYLANIFADVMCISIENYVIAHKIERVKELMVYDNMNLTEISYKLNYSSVAHLSTQFKKSTGLTPTLYKTFRQNRDF